MNHRTASIVIRLFLAQTLICIVMFISGKALSFSIADISIEPPAIGQGGVSLVTIKAGRDENTQIHWMGETITAIYDRKNKMWSGLIGADLDTNPGEYRLAIGPNTSPYSKQISVLLRNHGERHLTVPQKMVELDAKTLKRVRKEIKTVKKLLVRSADYSLWKGRWIVPVPGKVVSSFGQRTIINGKKRSPHSGVDLKAANGTPVKATNSGRVVLVASHYFSGLSVIVDHGAGIQSMYFHLSQASVQLGELIEKGALIGRSGSTGRVTGPHLHFGIRLNGGRVDPLKLIEISKGLGE